MQFPKAGLSEEQTEKSVMVVLPIPQNALFAIKQEIAVSRKERNGNEK